MSEHTEFDHPAPHHRSSRHSGLFDGVLAAGGVRALVDDTAWVQAMLDVEAALASAQAEVGLLAAADARAIAAACRAEYYDIAEIGAAAAGIGNPAGPLVRALTARVGAGPNSTASRFVHFGATSQDVVDTAAMLVAHRALGVLVDDLSAGADIMAELAAAHADTLQIGRSLLQQALPVTFGVTVAGWLSGVDAAIERLSTVRSERLAAQLGGAVGTLASLGGHGPAVLAAMARGLGLAEPVLPWHTDRTRIAELAGALGTACGVIATIAGDLVLLAQTEVAEVSEQGPPGSGGSSTMPHKRNPVALVAARAAAGQAPGLVATLFGTMAHEHQRAAGAWHAEWRAFSELLRSAGSAAQWLRTALGRLRVHPETMRANLTATRGVPLAERVTTELVPVLGRLAAHDAVAACCARALADRRALAEVLVEDPVIGSHLDGERITELLDPAGYLGSADAFVNRALTAHRKRRQINS